MEAFAISGMTFGLVGMVFAINAMNQVSEPEKKLKESGLLADDQQG
jgi:ABC-type uncharacterized transport system permease subunit